MEEELQAAIECVSLAGKLSLKYFGNRVACVMKEDKTPVTLVDKLCEREILKIIKKRFPSDSILSEESPELILDEKRRWIIDPIDGTKAFLRGLPTYGNMVAFEKGGKVAVGAINVPAMGKLIYAAKGTGAFENSKPICVSNETDISEAYVLHGRGKGFLEKGYLKKLRKLLNSVYHSWGMSEPYAHYLVATGRAEAFVETFPHPWDVAAAKIIIEEAGGKFSDLAGKDTLFSNTIAIYSNKHLHNSLINILKK